MARTCLCTGFSVHHKCVYKFVWSQGSTSDTDAFKPAHHRTLQAPPILASTPPPILASTPPPPRAAHTSPLTSPEQGPADLATPPDRHRHRRYHRHRRRRPRACWRGRPPVPAGTGGRGRAGSGAAPQGTTRSPQTRPVVARLWNRVRPLKSGVLAFRADQVIQPTTAMQEGAFRRPGIRIAASWLRALSIRTPTKRRGTARPYHAPARPPPLPLPAPTRDARYVRASASGPGASFRRSR